MNNELKEWLESQIEDAKASIQMYNNSPDLWSNWEELVWGNRCKINAYELTLEKMKRISENRAERLFFGADVYLNYPSNQGV